MTDTQKKLTSTISKISAQIYLSKIKEYSESALAREGLSSDLELDKTISFIKEILQADCVLLGDIVNPDEDGVLRGVADDQEINRCIDGMAAKVLTNLSHTTTVIHGDDEGAREEASVLAGDFVVMSGASVPIESGQQPIGILAVYYHDDVPVSESQVLYLQSMANVISHLLQSRHFFSQINIKNARHVIDAKREWEGTVDTLRQLVIVLDENARIIRANRTIQFWDIGSVDSQIGKHVETVILALTGNPVTEIYPDWNELWSNLSEYQHIVWEAENKISNKIMRFSLRTINKELQEKKHQGYAVLFVEDITQSKLVEDKLKKYTHQLESALEQRNRQLEEVNDELNQELEEHKKNKVALLRSEEKYSRLFQHSLSGICQLHAGRIRFYNERFFQVFKYPRKELNNKAFISLFHEDDRPGIMSLFANVEDASDDEKQVVARARDADGHDLWLEVRLDSIKFCEEKTIIVNLIDITDLKFSELSLRRSEARLQRLSCQLLSAQEKERKRLALELHDGLGQSLSTIKYSVEELARKLKDADVTADETVESIVEQIRDTIEETRRMSMDLRPSILDDLGLISTINWFTRKYQETYNHIQIDKQITIDENDVIDSRKIVIYRIIQEALNNVAKHSGADSVYIALEKLENGDIRLIISDNGCGMKKDERYVTTGLSGMKERAQLTGGVFSLADNQPCGVRIEIRWPAKVMMSAC